MRPVIALFLASFSTLVMAAHAQRSPVKNREPLASTPFTLLPLAAVKPEGWLKRELQIQAAGLSGHIEEVWPELGPDSGWLGGKGGVGSAIPTIWMGWCRWRINSKNRS